MSSSTKYVPQNLLSRLMSSDKLNLCTVTTKILVSKKPVNDPMCSLMSTYVEREVSLSQFQILRLVQKPSLTVGDKVYLLDTDGNRKGPYLVASLPSAGKCTLSLENGSHVKDGALIDVNDVDQR